MILLTEYFSKEKNKEAKVWCVTEKFFRVVLKDDSGSSYVTTFTNEEAAENFAEDWVMKDE